jgi:hypothetical protein
VITDQPGRTPPADPHSIELSYSHRHHWASTGDDSPQIWYVSADVHPDGGDEPVSHVADIEIILLDPYETRDPFGVLDGHDGDLGLIAETILDPASGRLNPELADRLEPFGSRILILNRVQLANQWRGLGIGVLLAGLAIKRLSGGCQAAVCYPSPLAAPGDEGRDDDPVERQAAVATLTGVWSQLGFEHFRDGVHVLDLALVTLNEALEHLHERLVQYA